MKGQFKFRAISVISIGIFILIWYLATVVFNFFPRTMLPNPFTILLSFINKLFSTVPDGGTLFEHIWASLIVALTGYVVGVLVGLPVGTAMAWFNKIDYIIRPVFDFLRTIPGIAWIPIFTVWLGIGLTAKAAIIFVGVFVGTVVNVYTGIKQTNEIHIWVAKIFGANSFEILWKVAIPSALPYIFTGLRVSFGMAWLGLIAAELIAAERGLGYMIQVARNFGRPDLVIVGMITIGGIGAILTIGLEMLEKKFVKGK